MELKEETFAKIAADLAKIALLHELDIECKYHFHGELCFPTDLSCYALNYKTLESPNSVNLKSYLIVDFPDIYKNSHIEDIVANEHRFIIEKLMNVCPPSYLLEINNGLVVKLMWCVE